MTTITLPKDLEEWAREEVSAGRAKSVEEFVAFTLREQRMLMASHETLVRAAYEAVARGSVREGDEVDAILDRWMRVLHQARDRDSIMKSGNPEGES